MGQWLVEGAVRECDAGSICTCVWLGCADRGGWAACRGGGGVRGRGQQQAGRRPSASANLGKLLALAS